MYDSNESPSQHMYLALNPQAVRNIASISDTTQAPLISVAVAYDEAQFVVVPKLRGELAAQVERLQSVMSSGRPWQLRLHCLHKQKGVLSDSATWATRKQADFTLAHRSVLDLLLRTEACWPQSVQIVLPEDHEYEQEQKGAVPESVGLLCEGLKHWAQTEGKVYVQASHVSTALPVLRTLGSSGWYVQGEEYLDLELIRNDLDWLQLAGDVHILISDSCTEADVEALQRCLTQGAKENERGRTRIVLYSPSKQLEAIPPCWELVFPHLAFDSISLDFPPSFCNIAMVQRLVALCPEGALALPLWTLFEE